MIVRACRNYDLLGLPRTTKMREFENWFYEHVVGPADSCVYRKLRFGNIRDEDRQEQVVML